MNEELKQKLYELMKNKEIAERVSKCITVQECIDIAKEYGVEVTYNDICEFYAEAVGIEKIDEDDVYLPSSGIYQTCIYRMDAIANGKTSCSFLKLNPQKAGPSCMGCDLNK